MLSETRAHILCLVSTYYLLWLLQSLILLPGGLITLLHCNRAPVLNLCSLSVILHSKSYEYSASQWAVELVWLPSTTFHHNSCLPPQKGTLISSCVCFKMHQTVVEHVVYWLDSMISSTHSDKYNKWQAYSTCWPLCFSMGVSTMWHPAIVKHVHLSLFAWVVTNQWAQHWHCTLDMLCGIFPYFPDWSQISDLQRAIASKAAETVTEIDEDTVYGMLCTGGLVQKHII